MVCPGNILHSKSTGCLSSPFNSWYIGVLLNTTICKSIRCLIMTIDDFFHRYNKESKNSKSFSLHELDDLLDACQLQLLPVRPTPA